MGLPIEIDFFQLSDRLPKGRSFHCLAKEALDQLAKDYNFNWTVLYQKLEITDKFFGIKSEPTAVLVSANTGMIGSPVIVELQEEDKKEKKNKKEEKRYGVKVSSLLNPEVRPGRLIRIEATLAIQSDLGKLEEVRLPNLTANGIYLVDTVRFAGSNYGADFLAEIEAGKLVA